MPEYFLVLSENAQRDLDSIFEYISSDSPSAASKLLDSFEEQFKDITKFPNIGFRRPDITKRDVRFCVLANKYQTIYAIKEDKIFILRVLTKYQNIQKII